jgi:hypothetical protein
LLFLFSVVPDEIMCFCLEANTLYFIELRMVTSWMNSLKCTAPSLIDQVSFSNYLKLFRIFSIDAIPFAVLPRRDLSQRFQSNILCEDCVRKQQIIYNESRHYVKDESVSCGRISTCIAFAVEVTDGILYHVIGSRLQAIFTGCKLAKGGSGRAISFM